MKRKEETFYFSFVLDFFEEDKSLLGSINLERPEQMLPLRKEMLGTVYRNCRSQVFYRIIFR